LPENQTALSSARERLDSVGAHALSDAELLTIILAPYSGPRHIHEAVRHLTAAPLPDAARASIDELLQQPGVGPAGASALLAAIELGRRAATPMPKRGDPILSPEKVFDLMRRLGQIDHEEFHVVLTDCRGRLIRTVRIATGDLVQVAVSPAQVFREALRAAAFGIIFVHGHPSGDVTPSSQDLELTDRLKEAAKLLGVKAHDHVIVAQSGHYSFVEARTWC